jgi:hypothetical protein
LESLKVGRLNASSVPVLHGGCAVEHVVQRHRPRRILPTGATLRPLLVVEVHGVALGILVHDGDQPLGVNARTVETRGAKALFAAAGHAWWTRRLTQILSAA